MKNHRELSDPITLRLPVDLLDQVEEIAKACGRTRSWVMVRAMRAYVATEGEDILAIERARREIEAGKAYDLDTVLADLDKILRDDAA